MEFSKELYMIGRVISPNRSQMAKRLVCKAMIKAVDVQIKCTIKSDHSVEERQARIKDIYLNWEAAHLRLSIDGIDCPDTSQLDEFISCTYPQLFSLSRS